MRAYLVKDETTFERLALEKYQEDESHSMQSSGSLRGHEKNPHRHGMYNFHISSDESALGGSTNSQRGRKKQSMASNSRETRNRSSDNHLSGSKREYVRRFKDTTLELEEEEKELSVPKKELN